MKIASYNRKKENRYKALEFFIMLSLYVGNIFLICFSTDPNDFGFFTCLWGLATILAIAPLMICVMDFTEDFVENYVRNKVFRKGKNKKLLILNGEKQYYKTMLIRGDVYMYKILHFCYDSDLKHKDFYSAQHEGNETIFFKDKQLSKIKRPKIQTLFFSSRELVYYEEINKSFSLPFSVKDKENENRIELYIQKIS